MAFLPFTQNNLDDDLQRLSDFPAIGDQQDPHPPNSRSPTLTVAK